MYTSIIVTWLFDVFLHILYSFSKRFSAIFSKNIKNIGEYRPYLELYSCHIREYRPYFGRESGVGSFCLGGTHDGVGRVGLGPPVGFFPLFKLEFSQQKKKFPRKSRCQPTPQMGDLMLVELESGLPCHKKDCGCRRVPPTITLVGIVPHLHPSNNFFFSFP